MKTDNGLNVELWQENPAYELLSQCSICLTTVGANTAELGALGVPMIVLLPTQQLDAMRSWTVYQDYWQIYQVWVRPLPR